MYFVEEFENELLAKGRYQDVQEFIREGILTYKIGAYRTSYFISYQAFLLHLRNKCLVEGIDPSIIYKKKEKAGGKSKSPERLLKELQDKLALDKGWENNLINELRKKENGIFNLEEEISDSIIYFRNRRNNAVHLTNKKFEPSTVKELWNFMIHNYSNFFVGGGKNAWDEKYKELSKYYTIIPEDKVQDLAVRFSYFSNNEQLECINKLTIDRLNYLYNPKKYSKLSQKLLQVIYEQQKKSLADILTTPISVMRFIATVPGFDPSIVNSVTEEDIKNTIKNERFEINSVVSSLAENGSEDQVMAWIKYICSPYEGHKELPSYFKFPFSGIFSGDGFFTKVYPKFLLRKAPYNFKRLIAVLLIENVIEAAYPNTKGLLAEGINPFELEKLNDISLAVVFVLQAIDEKLLEDNENANVLLKRVEILYNQFNKVDKEDNQDYIANVQPFIDTISPYLVKTDELWPDILLISRDKE